MSGNNDRNFLDIMVKQCRIYELALEEVIAQFDYNNDPEWRQAFKETMLKHAKDKAHAESESH